MERHAQQKLRSLLSIAGPVVLLAAWLAQTFLFDRWNGALNRLDTVEAIWDTYRSNHYALNAMRTDYNFAKQTAHDENVTRWQEKNLAVAKERVMSAVDPKTYSEVTSLVERRPESMDRLSSGSADGRMAVSIEIFRIAFEMEREQLSDKKASAQYAFWALYAFGSTLMIAAAVLQERLSHESSR